MSSRASVQSGSGGSVGALRGAGASVGTTPARGVADAVARTRGTFGGELWRGLVDGEVPWWTGCALVLQSWLLLMEHRRTGARWHRVVLRVC
jgi:TctA family transporter